VYKIADNYVNTEAVSVGKTGKGKVAPVLN
jgi:hypothetical protein